MKSRGAGSPRKRQLSRGAEASRASSLAPKIKAMTEGHGFYFWAPAARGGLHPLISMLGAGKAAPAQFPAAGRKFTRHSARGPEGPLERMTRFQTRYLHPKRGVTAFHEIHLLLQMDFFWVPAARGGLHHKGAGRTLCAPTKRTSPPDGLIRLAALGTWP